MDRRRNLQGLGTLVAKQLLDAANRIAFLVEQAVDAPREFLPIGLTLFLENAYRLIPTWYALFRNVNNPEMWSVFWLLAAVALIYLHFD